MPKHSNSYTIFFISAVAIISSLILSTAADALRERQQQNIALDKKKNILKSFGILPSDKNQIDSIYTDQVESMVVDIQCVLPALGRLVGKYHTKLISTSTKADFPNSEHIDFHETDALNIAKVAAGLPVALACC